MKLNPSFKTKGQLIVDQMMLIIIIERFRAGDTISELAWDYGKRPDEIESMLRSAFQQLKADFDKLS